MKNKLIALYLGTVLCIIACSSTNKTPPNSKLSDPLDASMASANKLCNDGKYDLALAQLKKSYSIASNNKMPSTINKQQAMVISAYGDCYLTQTKYDTAIESYEIALQSKYPPSSGYIGITKSYLAQDNYPKAALYISSYPGDENTEAVLQLKIKSLNGLLNNNYEISTSNRKLLQNKLSQLKQNLAQLNKNQSNIKDAAIQKPNNSLKSKTTTYTQADVNNAKIEKNNSQNLSNQINEPTKSQEFKDRIKLSNNGRHYIVIENGDTLFNVAKRSHLTQEKLVQINNLKNNYVPLGVRVYLD